MKNFQKPNKSCTDDLGIETSNCMCGYGLPKMSLLNQISSQQDAMKSGLYYSRFEIKKKRFNIRFMIVYLTIELPRVQPGTASTVQLFREFDDR